MYDFFFFEYSSSSRERESRYKWSNNYEGLTDGFIPFDLQSNKEESGEKESKQDLNLFIQKNKIFAKIH